MTQIGEGPGADPGLGAPAGGALLAERYQLEQHVNTDSAGRQIWRGVDVLLRRQVALVVRYPGGPAAEQMLQTAVAASRIVHPNLVGVYDAIDEHTCAYVVREWVDGASLRDQVATGPFDGTRAVAMAHAVSAGVNAVHAAGMSHGNLHPGTVLIGHDGRVVLADLRADGVAPGEEDVRAVGALLYFSLTGYWPHAEVAGPTSLPDALRDGAGALAAPRQVRAGVPDHLDNLTMDLLDRRLQVPPADVLAGEFARLDAHPDLPYVASPGPASYPGYPGSTPPAEPPYYPHPYQSVPGAPGPGYPAPPGAGYPAAPGPGYPEPDTGSGPIRLTSPAEAPAAKPSGRKIVLGLGGLLVIGVVGLLVGINWLTGSSPPENPSQAGSGAAATTPEPTPGDSGPQPEPIPLGPDQVRVVDPEGDRTELEGVEALVDDDSSTTWRTDTYYDGLQVVKPGIGVLIDLGEERRVGSVRVELTTGGATAELRSGDSDPGSSSDGDTQIYESYQTLGEPKSESGTTLVFSAFDPEETYQYLLVWFTELSPQEEGHRVEVQQIAVEGY